MLPTVRTEGIDYEGGYMLDSLAMLILGCRFLGVLAFVLCCIVPLLSASPTIAGVSNAASNLPPGLPDSRVAQGAIFVVYGTGLGPVNISIAAKAFQSTTLDGTSVSITVGVTPVSALMYYTSDGQIAALLPSITPVGVGNITVTYNKQASAPAPITVVANDLGIFTIDSSGRGPGIVTYPDYSLVSPDKAFNCGGPNTTCGAASPGDTLILWATGLGPVSGDDATGTGLGQNMPNIPLTLWLGGVEAPVTYQGRSGCCVGEDQIVFTVPNNVPVGCAVPLLVQIGNQISNSTVMPVATGSRNCTPLNKALAAVNLQQLVATPPANLSVLGLDDFNSPKDRAQFGFGKVLALVPGTQAFFSSFVDSQPLGTCAVYPNQLRGSGDIPITSIAALDAGPSLMLKGPNGGVAVPTSPLFQTHTGIGAAGTFLVPGSFTITGAGGADVGPINVNFTILAVPKLVSPQSSATVIRSNGLTVTWSGGDPNGGVVMLITGNTANNFATTSCTAPASAGSFTIPPYVLLALPTDPAGSFAFLSTQVYTPFAATGLNLGFVQTQITGAAFGIAVQ